MMEVAELIKKYLRQARMMQVATVDDGQPWVCTVYFVADGQQNLYWLSTPARRHSQEIVKNHKVAVTIPVKFDTQPVIGIQAAGVAEMVKDADTVKKVMEVYVKKYGNGKDFYNNFVAGKNEHTLYKFTPTSYALFDEVNFPDGQKHNWTPAKN